MYAFITWQINISSQILSQKNKQLNYLKKFIQYLNREQWVEIS